MPKRAATQPTLAAAWGKAPRRAAAAAQRPRAPLAAPAPGRSYVVDLFCGIGGFSCGAEQAGHVVALAVDVDAELLAVHARNHPHAHHLRLELGAEAEPRLRAAIAAAVPAGAAVHLHASPPCQRVSQAGALSCAGERQRQLDDGLRLVSWAVDFLARFGAASCSFEQVPHARIDAVLDAAMARHPGRLAYAVVDLARLGVPQRRRRLLAGSPALVARARAAAAATPPPLRAVLTPPRGATLVLQNLGKQPVFCENVRLADGTYYNPTIRHACYRSVDAVAFNVCARWPHRWCRPDHRILQLFTVHEMAALQTFPPAYRHAAARAVAYQGVGNAFPPRAAAAFLA